MFSLFHLQPCLIQTIQNTVTPIPANPPLLLVIPTSPRPPSTEVPKRSFIPLLPSPILGTIFLLFLSKSSASMLARIRFYPSFSASMLARIEFCIISFHPPEKSHQPLPTPNINNGPLLMPPFFNGFIPLFLLICRPLFWNLTLLQWKHGIAWKVFFRTTKMLEPSLLSKSFLTLAWRTFPMSLLTVSVLRCFLIN